MASVFDKLQQNVKSIIPYISQVGGQVNFSYTSDNSEVFGSTTGAKTAAKPFIIGFLPPDLNLLNFVPTESPTTKFTPAAEKSVVPQGLELSKLLIDGLDPALQPLAIELFYKAAERGYQIVISDGTRSLKAQEEIYNKGRDTSGPTVTDAKPGNSFHNYGLAFDIAFLPIIERNGVPSYTYPDPDTFAAVGSIGSDIGLQYGVMITNSVTGKKQVDATHFEYHPGLTLQQVKNGKRPSPQNAPSKTTASRPDVSSVIARFGVGLTTENASDPNINFGRNLRESDKRKPVVDAQIQALRRQLELFQAIPPLALLLNPREFTKNYEKSVDDGNKGRQKNIVHLWLEKPLSISGKGVTAAQYVLNIDGSGGLNHHNRIHSISYQNLMSLVLTYRNNGIAFTGSESSDYNQGIPSIPMSLFIYYDQHMYIGSFDSFEITDSGDKPHNLEYSFKFTTRYDFPVLSDNGTSNTPDVVQSIPDPLPKDQVAFNTIMNSNGGAGSGRSSVDLQIELNQAAELDAIDPIRDQINFVSRVSAIQSRVGDSFDNPLPSAGVEAPNKTVVVAPSKSGGKPRATSNKSIPSSPSSPSNASNASNQAASEAAENEARRQAGLPPG